MHEKTIQTTMTLTQTTMTDKERIAALELRIQTLESQLDHFKMRSSENLRRALLTESMLEKTNHSFKKVEKV